MLRASGSCVLLIRILSDAILRTFPGILLNCQMLNFFILFIFSGRKKMSKSVIGALKKGRHLIDEYFVISVR